LKWRQEGIYWESSLTRKFAMSSSLGCSWQQFFCVHKWHAAIGVEKYCSAVYDFVEIVKSIVKSWFFAISSNFTDFTRFQPDFINFRVFKAIRHVKYILTRKIIRFYELNHDFNNLAYNNQNMQSINLDSLTMVSLQLLVS
jgi:hypothetical protein